MSRPGIDGYVDDSLYPSNFHGPFSPTWTDRLIVRHGVAAPRRKSRDAFTMIDLGCGDGFGLLVNAAAYPEGRFIGIDAMPGHIDRARDLAARFGIANARFHCATFAEGLTLDLPPCDYATAQGILSWVTRDNQQALLSLASRALRPGGVLTIGYNALPGWTPVMPLQRLVRLLAEGRSGTPFERFSAAMKAIKRGKLLGKELLTWFDKQGKDLPPDYFAHEYLNGHWEPLWSGDAIAMVEAHGLHFAGPALTDRLRDDFAFRAVELKRLAAARSVRAREIVADVIHTRWFRIDHYVKGAFETVADDCWMDGWWMSLVTPEDATWETTTPAGTLRFDNQAARAILAHLADGPARVRDIEGIGEADLRNSLDALMTANVIRPAEAPAETPSGAALNALVREQSGLNGLAGRHGPVSWPRGQIAALDETIGRRLGL